MIIRSCCYFYFYRYSAARCKILSKSRLELIVPDEERSWSELSSRVKASRGGRPGLPVPNRPYGFCGRKAPLQKKKEKLVRDARSPADGR